MLFRSDPLLTYLESYQREWREQFDGDRHSQCGGAFRGSDYLAFEQQYVRGYRSIQRYRGGRSNQREFYREHAKGVIERERHDFRHLRWSHPIRHSDRDGETPLITAVSAQLSAKQADS